VCVVGREGADGFRVNVLCQQSIGAAVGKAFFDFLLHQPSPTAAVLKLLAKTPLPTTLQSCWERIFAFLFLFLSTFFVGPCYYNYISTSKLGDVLSYLAIFR
jgi:hypothetical protein